ncbi:MAG TPA: cyclic nucleotide-binding domain-containing protein, partial [Verrucomicrobiae bacterium]|nr:cyclic nucleotide-binding domain-containing protein [Verrucomicrobiae bacterium]
MSLDSAALQQVRTMPLFAQLDDTQLGCIEPGEVIDLPAGAVLVSEGERFPFFLVVLAGELRLTRTYDRQSVLMGSIKPGSYTGETTLLLDVPWMATARVAKSVKLFRVGEDEFWHMLSTCRTVARELFRSAANKVRNMEG